MMHSTTLRLICAALLLVVPVSALGQEDAVTTPGIPIGESRLELYGFVRIDAIYDDSRTDAAQTPTFVRSEDPRVGVRDQPNVTFHPRLTRVGGRVTPPAGALVSGSRLSARVEIDFQAGGRESRQPIRLRHGYVEMSWSLVTLLAGQTSDLMSPLFPAVNGDTLMWNAGNLGDRRPEFRLTWASAANVDGGRPTWTLAAGLGLPGAIDPKDLDHDGVRDGEASGVPNLQARLGFSSSSAVSGRSISVGASGHVGKESLTTRVGGQDAFTTWSASVDYEVEVAPRVDVRGELWTGENLSDFRGGIGQGIGVASGRGIPATGGWVETGVELSDVFRLSIGYTLEDPADRDIPSQGRVKNFAWYVVNQFRLHRLLLVGIDYLRWTTEFKDLENGLDNRVNVYSILRF